MGLNRNICSLNPNADWPVRMFYGLVTLYQGLFGIFVSGSLFHQLWQYPSYALVVIGVLLMTGSLLIVDGGIAMVRYCTTVDCAKVVPVMAIFQRRRPWLFIPPVFCYFVTLSRLEHSAGFSGWTLSYYIMLAVLGIVFSLRDGLVGVEVPDEP